MEEIIYFIAIVVYGIFIIRFILSWVGGDFDIDGDTDIDIGDIVSFKGLTHFLMGSSGWLATKNYFCHSLDWYDWLIAFVLGIIFVIILFYLYKFMMKLECKPTILSGKGLIGRSAKIYLYKGHYMNKHHFIITVENDLGTAEINAISDNFYSVGDMVSIIGYDGTYYSIL